MRCCTTSASPSPRRRCKRRPRAARRRSDPSRAAIRRAASIPCKGGGPNDYVYVYTSRANPEHWKRLLEVIGREDLIGDARYDTPAARSEHEAEINAIIAEWTSKHDKHEAMRCSARPASRPAPCSTPRSSPRTRPSHERGILQTMEHPHAADVPDAGLAGAPQRQRRRGQAGAAAGRAQRRGARELARPRATRDIARPRAGQGRLRSARTTSSHTTRKASGRRKRPWRN